MIRRDVTANHYLRSGGVLTVSAIVTVDGVLPKWAAPGPSLATEPRILPDCPACGDMLGNDDSDPGRMPRRDQPFSLAIARQPMSLRWCSPRQRMALTPW